MLSGLLYAVAANASVQSLLIAYGNSRSLQTRKQRWTADGTMARLMEAGAPVIERMRNEYWGRVRTPLSSGNQPAKHRPNFSVVARSRDCRTCRPRAATPTGVAEPPATGCHRDVTLPWRWFSSDWADASAHAGKADFAAGHADLMGPK